VKRDRRSQWPSIVASGGLVASLGLLVVLGLQLSPWADDYVNHLRLLDTGGPIAFTLELYRSWTGRLLSSFVLAIAVENLAFTPVIGGLLGAIFVLCAALVVRIVNDVVGAPRDRQEEPRPVARSLWLLTIVAAGLWITATQFLSENIYWLTGGIVYLLPLALGLLWLVVVYRLDVARSDRRLAAAPLLGWVVLSAILGTAHEELSIGLGFAATCLFGLGWLSNPAGRRVDGRLFNVAAGLVALTVGTVVLVIAPGNFVHSDVAPGPSQADPAAGLAAGLAVVLVGVLPLIRALLLGLVISAVLFASGSEIAPWSTVRRLALWGTVLLLAGIASLLPVVVFSSFAWLRTYFFMITLAYAGAVMLGFAGWLELAYRRGSNGLPSPKLKVLRVIGGAVLAIYLIQIGNEIQLARSLQIHAAARAQVLSAAENRNMSVEVGPLQGDTPSAVHYYDIVTDPDSWVNRAVAREFGLAALRLRE